MSAADDIVAQLVIEARELVAPLQRATASPRGLSVFLGTFGWRFEGLVGASVTTIENALKSIDSLVLSIQQAHSSADLESVADSLGALVDVFTALSALRDGLAAAGGVNLDQPTLEALGADLVEHLILDYVLRRSPALFQLLELATLVRYEAAVPLTAGTSILRYPIARPTLKLKNLPKLLSDPVGHLRASYMPSGVLDAEASRLITDRVFGRIESLVLLAGGAALAGMRGSTPAEIADPANAALLRSLTVAFEPPPAIVDAAGSTAVARVGATLTLVPTGTLSATGTAGPGVDIVPFGMVGLSRPLERWVLDLELMGTLPPFFASPSGLVASLQGATAEARATMTRTTEGGRAFLFGAAEGTRLEIGTFDVSGGVRLGGADSGDVGMFVEVGDAALVVAGGDGDGFLARVLPPEGVRVAFDFAIGWSRSRGLGFRGSAGLDATFPVNKDIAGVVRIQQLHVALRPDATSVQAIAGVTVSLQLGPIKAAVERFGVRAVLTFPERGGNLGAANLALEFQPPSGAALAIDAGVVTGGGYLLFDPARAQYAGAVHLAIAETLTLTAFGLLTTRMPDGSQGFSLLVLISVRFTPAIQLGYGFALSGIGGLLGVNRTVAVDPLRAGLRAGSIGRILFPEDPIRNAPQIVSDLQTIFPAAPGRFLFGPMVQISWGVPPLLTIDLGVILELPAPVRLFILGRLRLLLPEARAPIVHLQLDSLGMIDFERGDVALDAVLYDSRIAQFTVTGEMALRANVGAAPTFALAIGGFHPRFPTPTGFPGLERVAITLATGHNPRLRLEAYLAVTTNTVQFGAQLELYAEAAGFSIQGLLGFDTLIQFAPFGLAVELRAHVALKRGTTSLMAVQVDVALTGPAPWRARGTATFKVLFLSGSIRFDAQFGKAEVPPLPPPVRVRPLLLEALRDGRNWATQLPAAELPVVSFRDQPGALEVFVHPLADLQVRQRVVPLGRQLTQYGNTAIEGEREFRLAVVSPTGTVLTTAEAGVEPVNDAFAPAQFRAMTDDEKLVAPAFEQMQAGIRFALRTYTSGAAVVEQEMTYERKTIYTPGAPAAAVAPVGMMAGPGPEEREPAAMAAPLQAPTRVDPRGPAPRVVRPELVERVAAMGAAGRAPIARTGPAKYRAPAAPIKLKPPRFVALETGPTGRPRPAPIGGRPRVLGSYSEVTEAGRRQVARDPRARVRVKVVRSFD